MNLKSHDSFRSSSVIGNCLHAVSLRLFGISLIADGEILIYIRRLIPGNTRVAANRLILLV